MTPEEKINHLNTNIEKHHAEFRELAEAQAEAHAEFRELAVDYWGINKDNRHGQCNN